MGRAIGFLFIPMLLGRMPIQLVRQRLRWMFQDARRIPASRYDQVEEWRAVSAAAATCSGEKIVR